jgi:hypothetical protein
MTLHCNSLLSIDFSLERTKSWLWLLAEHPKMNRNPTFTKLLRYQTTLNVFCVHLCLLTESNISSYFISLLWVATRWTNRTLFHKPATWWSDQVQTNIENELSLWETYDRFLSVEKNADFSKNTEKEIMHGQDLKPQKLSNFLLVLWLGTISTHSHSFSLFLWFDVDSLCFLLTLTFLNSDKMWFRFSHSLETYLRSLGMPTSLKGGVIELLSEYTVCKAGEPLTPEQAKLLVLWLSICEILTTQIHSFLFLRNYWE